MSPPQSSESCPSSQSVVFIGIAPEQVDKGAGDMYIVGVDALHSAVAVREQLTTISIERWKGAKP